ncbi:MULTISPECIES: hypothetical protein [unclassified Bradyrhizobium]|uniref:hypothetical protein n=1 Tax=unclassified Bradyrhizobium TaxID=2631580 RepID=UPI0028ED09C2|nr:MULTISPECIES: hypothetical protein [unclassified Bradyrhizobium]
MKSDLVDDALQLYAARPFALAKTHDLIIFADDPNQRRLKMLNAFTHASGCISSRKSSVLVSISA